MIEVRKYIDQNKIPHNNGNKSDLEFFKFVVDWMYKLNNKVPACWSDCWPPNFYQPSINSNF